MGLHLIGTFLLGLDLLSWQTWLSILVGCLGLSVVIFVHEMGHFLVAKACGVKCEKFYIGFDVGGAKLWSMQWGETEYGIGALPLGGYVKMLGQEDNPARVAEEMERAKLAGDDTGEGFQLDPRSYLAQSVPERMAIISAGVIMNVIFAVIFASVAYAMGVEVPPCTIGSVLPGEAAWQAGLQTGDRVIRINGAPTYAFNDLMKNVALGDIENGVQMEIERPGVPDPITVSVYPVRKAGSLVPRIGVGYMLDRSLNSKQATIAGTPASAAQPPFLPGDTITAIAGQPVSSYLDIEAVLVRKADQELKFIVTREKKNGLDVKEEQLEIVVSPNPVRWIGVETDLGPISAVQSGSPAAAAGLKPGDQLIAIEGKAPGDALRIPDRLRALAGQRIALQIQRPGEVEPVSVQVVPQDVPWDELSPPGAPMSAPAIGIAYRIGSRVVTVEPDSPADRGGVKPGDLIQSARVFQPKSLDLEKASHNERETTLDFTGDNLNLPGLFFLTQQLAPGSKIELVLEGGRKVELEPTEQQGWYYPHRGLAYRAIVKTRRAGSIGEALRLGKDETIDSLLLVVRFLKKIGTQVSPMSAGGPFTILKAAADSADAGMSQLLLFLCVLSANLAVINFLPIPVLDGGHMMFLAYEGITGKPLNEKWFMRLTYAGFAFILMLMVFVIGLDVNRLIEWLQSLFQ